MRSNLWKLDSFTLETSKNHLTRTFVRNGRVRVKYLFIWTSFLTDEIFPFQHARLNHFWPFTDVYFFRFFGVIIIGDSQFSCFFTYEFDCSRKFEISSYDRIFTEWIKSWIDFYGRWTFWTFGLNEIQEWRRILSKSRVVIRFG